MTKDPKELQFIEDKEETLDCLETLQEWLDACLDSGMHDVEEAMHNQILDLIEDTKIAKSKPQLEEVIVQARTIERDLDAWLSQKGRTTLSLDWPRLNPLA